MKLSDTQKSRIWDILKKISFHGKTVWKWLVGFCMFLYLPFSFIGYYARTKGNLSDQDAATFTAILIVVLIMSAFFVWAVTTNYFGRKEEKLRAKYKNQTETAQSKLAEALEMVEALQAKLADIEHQPNDPQNREAPKERVIVNKERWEASFLGGCRTLVDVIQEGKQVVRADFQEKMTAAAGMPTITKADLIAWQCLPDQYKSGTGRPPKNSKKQTKSS